MFDLAGVAAAFTSRKGGVSAAPYAYLNLGDHVGDDPAAVAANRKRLEAAVGAPIMWMNQVHSDQVHRVQPGFTTITPKADAMVVDVRDFARLDLRPPALAVMVADCLPVLIGSLDGQHYAAVHVGRAGLCAGIIQRVVNTFAARGVPASQLHAALGPSICGHCYEVPYDLQQQVCAFVPGAWSQTRWGTPGVDIASGAIQQLRRAGVTITFRSKRCTFEDPSLFSYRRSAVTGRFVGVVRPQLNQSAAAPSQSPVQNAGSSQG